MAKIDVKDFGLKATSRIKAFVFKFISVPAKWVKTARQHVLMSIPTIVPTPDYSRKPMADATDFHQQRIASSRNVG